MYNAKRVQGLRPDIVRNPNLLRVLEINLEVREEGDLLEQNGAKPTNTEFSFSYLTIPKFNSKFVHSKELAVANLWS